MTGEPTARELMERLETMEQSYEARMKLTEERHLQDLENISKNMSEDADPLVNCIGCGGNIFLSGAYWDIADSDIRCKMCGSILTVTITNGELKKVSLKTQGSTPP